MVFLGLAAFLVLAFGCGPDPSPVANEEEALAPASEGGAVLLAFSPEAAQRAAKRVKNNKRAPGDPRAAAATIGPAGGKLTVEDFRGGKNSEITAEFIVPRGALRKNEEITMRVDGELLSQMVVAFTRDGVEFSPNASLKLVLGKELVDLDSETLQLWHISNNGETVEPAMVGRVHMSGKRKITVIVGIPGFSRYALINY
jgi:hypothetical protein